MTIADIGLLVLRLGLGLTFAAHGAQKAFGWWNGPGAAGWRGAMERMGFRPVGFFAAVSTGIELVGGIFMALGLLTPFIAGLLIAQTVVIIAKAHWSKGFFSTAGGFEFPLSLGLAALAIALIGPGAVSLDGLLDVAWAPEQGLALIVLGALGGGIALQVPRLTAPQAPAPQLPARGSAATTGTDLREPSRPARNPLPRNTLRRT
jgi:putative oxidoreductase